MVADQKNKDWVYVIVGKDGGKESFLGLFDETTQMNFIPSFVSKEAAQDCFLSLPRERGKKYEVQAVHIDELNDQAARHEFVVATVDKDGRILR
ncbi:MAG: hypothetical protein ACK5PS_05405 [Desulfopila sp.]